jgi:hypothetical protein
MSVPRGQEDLEYCTRVKRRLKFLDLPTSIVLIRPKRYRDSMPSLGLLLGGHMPHCARAELLLYSCEE